MRQYELSALADSDLADIWLYIALDSPENADRFMDRLYEAFQKLADMPGMGHQRDDLAEQSLRVWPVGQCLIMYRPDTNPLEICASYTATVMSWACSWSNFSSTRFLWILSLFVSLRFTAALSLP